MSKREEGLRSREAKRHYRGRESAGETETNEKTETHSYNHTECAITQSVHICVRVCVRKSEQASERDR